MITYEMVNEARLAILKNWGEEDGGKVINAWVRLPHLHEMLATEFLQHCTACGGNWNKMFLSGIKELWTTVWDAIPEDMGEHAFDTICAVLVLCGVDTSEK